VTTWAGLTVCMCINWVAEVPDKIATEFVLLC